VPYKGLKWDAIGLALLVLMNYHYCVRIDADDIVRQWHHRRLFASTSVDEHNSAVIPHAVLAQFYELSDFFSTSRFTL
jgi:hypothetical protein